ncbi:MAG: DUF2264 domain-containing protein [Eubacteriales bacterium]|nr:DUF2264 domain-containing protein [Eubacteriales bacterium]
MEQKILLKTKAQFATFVESYCAPLRQYYSSSASKVYFPEKVSSCYSDEIANIENFARPLWALSGLFQYTDDTESVKTVLDMIKHGVSEDDPLYWGEIQPYSQIIVELPSIALFLYVHKEYYRVLS